MYLTLFHRYSLRCWVCDLFDLALLSIHHKLVDHNLDSMYIVIHLISRCFSHCRFFIFTFLCSSAYLRLPHAVMLMTLCSPGGWNLEWIFCIHKLHINLLQLMHFHLSSVDWVHISHEVIFCAIQILLIIYVPQLFS